MAWPQEIIPNGYRSTCCKNSTCCHFASDFWLPFGGQVWPMVYRVRVLEIDLCKSMVGVEMLVKCVGKLDELQPLAEH